ncbi:MAG: hypothetical protein KF734_04435 [Saprospiraceae bacterium]|nr:hypothetical protein [Saprospiraceae bacterium]
MSITKTTYSPTHSISPRYLRIEKDASTDIIIIDDCLFDNSVAVHTEIDKDTVWLKVLPGFELTILDDEPSSINAFSPSHENWSATRVFVQSAEAFVVGYTDSAKTTQSSVTGYGMGSNDVMYIKIERQSGTVTIFQ